MRYIFTFPDIGEGISEGTILEWYVENGQSISSGDNLVQVETDKVTADIPSPRDGIVVSRFGKPGDIIKVGNALVELDIQDVSGEESQKIATEKPKGKTIEHVQEESFGVVGKLEVAGDSAYLQGSDEGMERKTEQEVRPSAKVLATPVARALAKNIGVDISKVKGTGPRGRITKEDINQYYHSHQKQTVEMPPIVQETQTIEYVPLTQIRKTIASKMLISKTHIPHFTAFEEVEVSELVKIRNSRKSSFLEKGLKLTYLPFIIKATTESLKRHKILNCSLDMENNRIIYKYKYNVGIAVGTPDGLIVPVIRDADKMTINELTIAIMDISQRARDRKLTLDELRGGTFTITNFGSLGGIFGTPIINYPEVAILGIGRIRETPVIKDGAITKGTVLPLSLSADHRIVDGAEASRFLNTIMGFLKDPISIWIG
jgi:pyruvate dehydrogenase E2 component (dihydrolipoamide acetyltransferase)